MGLGGILPAGGERQRAEELLSHLWGGFLRCGGPQADACGLSQGCGCLCLIQAVLAEQGGARGHGVKAATWEVNYLGVHGTKGALPGCAQGEQVPGEEGRAVDLLLSLSLLLLPT